MIPIVHGNRCIAPFAYPGGKQRLANLLAYQLDRLGYALGSADTYCEPFLGGGSTALRAMRELRSSTNVILADANPRIVNFWRCVHTHTQELCERFSGLWPPSKELFQNVLAAQNQHQGPEGAAHQLFIRTYSFGASASDYGWRSPKRGVVKRVMAAASLLRAFPALEIVERDAIATIKQLPADAVCYLDPPYLVAGPTLYECAFEEADHARLANALRVGNIRWLLSYDDHPMIRSLYDWASIETIQCTYTGAKGKWRAAQELVISK